MARNNIQSIFVGDTVETTNSGTAEVASYTNCDNIIVRFHNTGHEQRTTSVQFQTGVIKDRSVKFGTIKVGDWFNSNNCGRCTVLSYNSAKDILVRFEDSGIEKTFSGSQLNAGTISDKILRVVSVGDAFVTKLSGVATVVEILPKSKVIVKFEDGNLKECSKGSLYAGSVYNGTWNYTQDEAVDLMCNKHSQIYDYSKVVFKTVKDKIIVTCPIHGDFDTSFDGHYNAGTGCPECGIARRAAKKALPEDTVFAEIRECHGDTYDYSKSVYVNNETKIEIVCREHGSFWQSPEKHKTGQGCPVCVGNIVMTVERFMPLLPDKHTVKYDYSLITDSHFEDDSKKLPIICKEHGVFHQHYRNHLSGSGCRKCAKFGFKTNLNGSLYILGSDGIIKVGITNNEDVSVRVRQIEVSSGKSLEILKTYRMDGQDCSDVETDVLSKLRKLYKNPTEGFDGYTECFIGASADEVISLVDKTIRRLCEQE